MLLLIYMG